MNRAWHVGPISCFCSESTKPASSSEVGLYDVSFQVAGCSREIQTRKNGPAEFNRRRAVPFRASHTMATSAFQEGLVEKTDASGTHEEAADDQQDAPNHLAADQGNDASDHEDRRDDPKDQVGRALIATFVLSQKSEPCL